ncbi:MAG: protein translocase subunit SecF [Patescibacteria group bacterium]|nr:protein translocase subunit SecF [Patescibacteria group bacterium]
MFFQFIKNRLAWYILSGAMAVASIVAIFFFGLRPGIDFAGGTLMEVKFEKPGISQDQIREVLIKTEEQINTSRAKEADYAPISFESAIIQPMSDSFVVRSLFIDDQTHVQILAAFNKDFGKTEELQFQTIGPTVGLSMQIKAAWAIGLAAVFMIIFIAYAFRKVPAAVSPWKFGVSAVVAVLHDVLIVCGFFAVLGRIWNVEVDLLFITALLTVMGFSVHDTIVVFDRLRENLSRSKGRKTFDETANDALNETMSRSINTSMTTVITLAFLLVFGGASIRWFVAAMLFGIIVGTYSSIFFATPLLVSWSKKLHK